MRKILLATSALVSLAAGVAFAEGPSVMLGGSVDFQAGIVNQKRGYNIVGGSVSSALPTGGTKAHDFNFNNAAALYVKVQNKADYGMVYGAYAGIDTTAAHNRNPAPKDHRTFIFMETNMGKMELGSNYGVDATMKVDATTIARATGGIGGNWNSFANVGTGMTTAYSNANVNTSNNYFHVNPNLYQTSLQDAGVEESRKITYYTPKWNGMQFGVSYTRDSGMLGSTTTAIGTEGTDAENIFTLGLSYGHQMGDMMFNLAVVGETGSSEANTARDLRSFQFGGDFMYRGFAMAGSYGSLGKSLITKASNTKRTYFWTLGASYVQGPIGTSITYMNSKSNGNKFRNFVFGVDYALAPGLTPYAELAAFKLQPNRTIAPTVSHNDGSVIVIGTEMVF